MVILQSANYCKDDPVTNYTLKIVDQLSGNQAFTTSTENFIMVSGLNENSAYMFKISAANTVGEVDTNSKEFCKMFNVAFLLQHFYYNTPHCGCYRHLRCSGSRSYSFKRL